MATAIGLGLFALVTASLLIHPLAFVALIGAASLVAVWELRAAFVKAGMSVPVVPLLLASSGIIVAAYGARGDGLALAFVVGALALVAARALEGGEGSLLDAAGGVFILMWVPLLAGFAVILASEPGGWRRVVATVLLTSASDTGGFAFGVLFGRHHMAPTISPKKSWEGLGGSFFLTMLVGVAASVWLLDLPWWMGLPLGFVAVGAATLGDLAESMVKRDLGVKDMGSLLPEHGGVMERLDSILVALPLVWWLVSWGLR